MLVLMMQFRSVGVGVLQGFVGMHVAVLSGDFKIMVMIVMPVIVPVPVLMSSFHVDMEMLMFLGDRQISSRSHDRQSYEKRTRYGVAERDPGDQNADERRGGVIDARPCRAELSLGFNIEEDAEPVGNKAQKQGDQDIWEAFV